MASGMVPPGHPRVGHEPWRVRTGSSQSLACRLAQATPTRGGTLPRHRPIVLKEISCHVRIALRGVQIIAEFLRFLPPDMGVNLKEPEVMVIPFASHDLALLRPVLATTLALGVPWHYGRLRIRLYNDDGSRVYRLGDRAALFKRGHVLTEDCGNEE